MNNTDITKADDLEIRVVRHADGFRIWVDGADGNLFRAYRVANLYLSGLRLDEPGEDAP